MMIVRKIFLVSLILSLLAVVALLAVLLLDPGFFKSRFEAWASDALGRRLAIDGEVRLDIGPTVRISAAGVRLANAAWASEPEMLRASRMVLELELASLLRDTVVIPRFELAGLDVLLQRNADEQGNWQFDSAGQDPEAGWPKAPALLVKLISMPGARLRYSGPRLSRPLELRFDTVEQHPGVDGLLDFNASGWANEIPLQFSASVGPLANLLDGRDIRITLQGELGELKLAGNGHIDDMGSPANTHFDLDLSGPDADYLGHHLGVRNLGSGPVKLAASVAPGTGNRGISGKLSGVLGELSLEGRGELVDPANLGKLALELKAAGPDLSLLNGLFGLAHLPAEGFSVELHMERSQNSLSIDTALLQFKDAQLQLHGTIDGIDRLRGSNIAFELKGADIARLRALFRIPGLATGPFELSGQIKHSAEGRELLDVTASTGLAKFTVNGPLGDAPDFFGSELQFTAAGADFGAIGTALGIAGFPGGSFDAHGGLHWSKAGLEFQKSALQVAGNRLGLDGLLGARPFAEQVDLRIALQGKDPRMLTNALGQPALPAVNYTVSGRLQRAGGPWQLQGVEARLGGARLQLDGRLGSPHVLPGIALSFTAEGPDLSGFSAIARRKLPGLAFKAVGDLSGSSDALRLRQLKFTAGKLAIAGSATLGLPIAGARGGFDLSAAGEDLDALLPELDWLPLAHQRAQLSARGAWQKGRLRFDQLQLEAGSDSNSDRVSVKGEFRLAPELSATALQLDARIADLAAVVRRAGLAMPAGLQLPASALRFTARLSGTPAAFALENIAARIGDSGLSGRVQLGPGVRPDVAIELHSKSLDLTPFVPGERRRPRARSAAADLLIPETSLPLDLLGKLDGRLLFSADKLRFAGLDHSALRIEARLRDGHLAVAPFGFANSNGAFSARLDIRSAGTTPLVSLAGSGTNLLLDFGASNPFGLLRYDGRIDLAGEGSTLRALAASLRGTVRLSSAGGRLPNSRLSLVYSDFFSQLLSTLNPLMKREPYTDVVCAVYALRAEGGVLHTDPALVIRTSAIDIMSYGSADLHDESIDLKFKTAARKGLGFSASQMLNPYLKVSGTLAKPELTLDQTGTLISGGTAVATSGLSILASSVWERLSRQTDPCGSVAAEADRRAAAATR